MPNLTGGKNYKRTKHSSEKPKYVEKQDDQMYARILQNFGNRNLLAYCNDNKMRLCHIRGSIRKDMWISVGDIVSEVRSNVPCEILLNDIAFKADTPLVLCNGPYTEKKIRFYIDSNNIPDRINLSYKAVILKSELRRQLSRVEELYSGESVCRQGVISKR